MNTFSETFLWGAATASYQIEGSPWKEGGGYSVWDTFCTLPGKVWRGQSGETACDHYRRLEEDVDIMAELGLRAYRFSVSWPRVLPEGSGRVNQQGLDFYGRLVDLLLDRGIEPCITLFHWDYPHELFLKGGWMHPDSPLWFQDYAELMVRTLGDRVSRWITLNEPQCFVSGHGNGYHAPGLQLDIRSMTRIIHHVLLSHGKGAEAVKSVGGDRCRVGIAPVGVLTVPAERSPQCIELARSRTFSIPRYDAASIAWNNPVWFDPILTGSYPEEYLSRLGGHLKPDFADDLPEISREIDFIGLNIYQADVIRPDGRVIEPEDAERTGEPISGFNWPIVPESLYWGPKFFHEAYRKPIYITENGTSVRDYPDESGRIHDWQRMAFTRQYLRCLREAVLEGVPVKGYFHWSLMDNFEWAEGFRERFGLVYVDFRTQRRMIKDSGRWYRKVIESRGGMLDQEPC